MVDYYGRYLGSYQSSNSIKTRLIGSNPRTKRKATAGFTAAATQEQIEELQQQIKLLQKQMESKS